MHEARSDQQLLEAVQQAIDRDRMVRQQRAEPTTLRRRQIADATGTRGHDAGREGSLNRQIAAQLRTSEARSWLTEHR